MRQHAGLRCESLAPFKDGAEIVILTNMDQYRLFHPPCSTVDERALDSNHLDVFMLV